MRRPVTGFLGRIAAVFALLALMAVALELLLGFLRLERFDREFTPRSSYPLFVPGEGVFAGYYHTNPYFSGSLNFQKFRTVKGAGVCRVFILGGSAAFGWPGEDPDSFAGYLRRALERVAPGRFEVVNAAGISYGSHRVLDLLRDVVRHEPDLVVIYSGNNEYVERNVLPAGERRGGILYAIRDRLSRTNVYRAVRLAVRRAPGLGKLLDRPRGADITDLRSNPVVARSVRPRSPEIDAEVYRNYRSNLAEMARLLGGRPVPSVFCSVPVNLDSWRPADVPLRFRDRDDALRWRSAVEEGKAILSKDPSRAAEIFGELLRRQPAWAPGAFHRGEALASLGRYKEALEMYCAARDGDARPMRAFGSFNDAVRAVAGAARGTTFLDLERIFREGSPHGITGDALVRDYCHPTEAGHKLVATALLPFLLGGAGAEGIRKDAEAAIAEDSASLTKPPLQRAMELYATGMTDYFNGSPRKAEKIFREVLALDPGHLAAMNNLGLICMESGRRDEARALFTKVLSADPRHIHAHYNLGLLLLQDGDLRGAEDRMLAVLSINPEYPKALLHLGDISQRRGAFREALEYYQGAVSGGADDSRVRLMMGKAYLAAGDRARAVRELEKALEFDPASEEAYSLMETAR